MEDIKGLAIFINLMTMSKKQLETAWEKTENPKFKEIIGDAIEARFPSI